MPNQLVLPNKLAKELTDLSAGDKITWDDCKPFNLAEVVENRLVNHSRWSLIYEFVIRTGDNALWRRLYSTGATESQCEDPFEYEGPEVPFDQVKAMPEFRVKYVPFAS